MSASPGVRGLRAAVFAAVCVLLAVGAHTAAVGETPPAGAQALAFAAVLAAGWMLGGRERSLVGITGATLTAQGGLHAGFGAATRGGSGGGMPGMRMPGRPDAAHHGAVRSDAVPHALVHHTVVHPGVLHHTTPHTLAAHVLAALLTSWWLRRGEAAFWSLLRRAVVLVPGLVAWWRGSARGARSTPVVRRRWRLPEPRRLLLRHAVRRRGPPARVPYPA